MDSAITKYLPIKPLPVVGSMVGERHIGSDGKRLPGESPSPRKIPADSLRNRRQHSLTRLPAGAEYRLKARYRSSLARVGHIADEGVRALRFRVFGPPFACCVRKL